MEQSTGPGYQASAHSEIFSPRSEPPRRRFGLLAALIRIGLAIAIIAFVVVEVMSWVADRPQPPQRMNRERSFTVEVMEPNPGAHSADIIAYGQVAASRTMDIRALVQGRVIEISPNLSVGSTVEEGETLLRIDPFAYDGAVVEAEAGLADAELSLAEAEEAYALEERNIAAAETALQAARTDLERARALLSSGAATQQTVETRELTASEREQALVTRQSNLVTLNAQILRQRAAIEQARYAIEAAHRDRQNTEIAAPFTGVVTARNVTVGAYVGTNESVVSLYDLDALEVSFNVSDRDYAALVRDGLAGRPIAVSRTGGASVPVEGVIARTAPEIDAATGGVTLFGQLDAETAALLRPGTFVSVRIAGREHENALRVPETAIYDDDHLYVIRESRMAAIPVEILERDNEEVIIAADIPEGERIITTRLSQAGEGVAVMVEGEEAPMPAGGRGPGG